MTTTPEVFATTQFVTRPLMGGQGVDVLDAEWNIDRKGGFTCASIDVMPPKSISRYADNVNEPVEVRDANQHILWEGRVEEPDLGFVEADRLTIEATGYSGYLSDDEYFRRCYVDGIIASWQTDQSTKYSDRFTVGIEDDDKLVLRVSCQGGDPGQTPPRRHELPRLLAAIRRRPNDAVHQGVQVPLPGRRLRRVLALQALRPRQAQRWHVQSPPLDFAEPVPPG